METQLKFIALTLLPAALLCVSCSSTAPSSNPGPEPATGAGFSDQAGFGGAVVVTSTTEKAIVVSMNPVKQEIILKRTNEKTVACKIRPGTAKFMNIKVGDEVTIAVGEELAVFLGANSVPAQDGSASAQISVLVPKTMVSIAEGIATESFSAKVTAIDVWNYAVTLQFPDGRIRTKRISDAINIGDVNVGDEVSVRATEAVAIVIQKS